MTWPAQIQSPPNLLLSKMAASGDTIFISNLPPTATETDVSDVLKKYGGIVGVKVVKGQGCAFVQFNSREPVDKLAGGEVVEYQGKQIDLKRTVSKISTPLALVPSKAPPQPPAPTLDVCIIRGACTSTAIGIAAMYAKSKATTVVLWDRAQYLSSENKVLSTLQKRTGDEERGDTDVITHASAKFGASKPRCALLHVQSDKPFTAPKQDPLMQSDAVIKSQALNHLDLYGAYLATSIYAPWVHAFRAVFYILVPPSTPKYYTGDMATSMIQTTRIVKADPLRLPDGSGWTIGLQLKDEDADGNASTVFHSMNRIMADEPTKHSMSGKIITMDPRSSTTTLAITQ